MIKFFRRIRRKLLSENTFRKYLIYAIGEILLVVVGILLALQINQWNQNRINRNLEVKYSRNLLVDLLKDQKSLESGLKILLNTSPSYVTQIFRGQKTINLLTLAKLQQIFEIEFKIISEKVHEKAKNKGGKGEHSNPGFKKRTGTSKKREKDHAL